MLRTPGKSPNGIDSRLSFATTISFCLFSLSSHLDSVGHEAYAARDAEHALKFAVADAAYAQERGEGNKRKVNFETRVILSKHGEREDTSNLTRASLNVFLIVAILLVMTGEDWTSQGKKRRDVCSEFIYG